MLWFVCWQSVKLHVPVHDILLEPIRYIFNPMAEKTFDCKSIFNPIFTPKGSLIWFGLLFQVLVERAVNKPSGDVCTG